ncbi:MAG: zinc ribbon domain-containing protein, partial [Anaerolineales bacterium]|nr:zinc ribbon domain-containing protein [Anaerolineales bacterium]
MICAKCGRNLSDDSSFCEYCGARVGLEIPKREAVQQLPNQQGIPGGGIDKGGMRREEISTNQSAAKKPAKSWVWIILVVLIVLCCCV